MRGDRLSVFKFNKISFGILILVYVFSVAICSLEFNHTDGHAAKDNIPDTHCGIELNRYTPPEIGSFALLDLTSYQKLYPFIVEPKLPILVYSILKIPKLS